MGLLIDGVWSDAWYDTKASQGKFVRDIARFRNWVTKDGTAGPSGEAGFAAEAGRYHLYVSYACPWAHRTLMMRSLKGLEDYISISVVHPYMVEDGWTFATDFNGATGDTLMGKRFMRDVYIESYDKVSGRVTVPVLWDKKQHCIVSNESSEIIRMFNSAFDHLTGNTRDFWPEAMRDEIEQVNELVYHNVNNGVYKSGFATDAAVYASEVTAVFEALDKLEARLSQQRYLMGAKFTEADIRLFATLIRFDPVYVGHFKCNLKRIYDYPNLYHYMKEIYQLEAIKDTVFFDHIKFHYYASHNMINNTRIVPLGPIQDLDSAHDRDRFEKADL